jgi:hypothetical protein
VTERVTRKGRPLSDINRENKNQLESAIRLFGAFLQDWTSFGGSGNRPNTNQMNLQPFVSYFLPDDWSVGYSGNIPANWKTGSAGDTWTVPLGLSVAKVFRFNRLPVRIALAGQYMVHRPDA